MKWHRRNRAILSELASIRETLAAIDARTAPKEPSFDPPPAPFHGSKTKKLWAVVCIINLAFSTLVLFGSFVASMDTGGTVRSFNFLVLFVPFGISCWYALVLFGMSRVRATGDGETPARKDFAEDDALRLLNGPLALAMLIITVLGPTVVIYAPLLIDALNNGLMLEPSDSWNNFLIAGFYPLYALGSVLLFADHVVAFLRLQKNYPDVKKNR